jgi:ABC-type multidrug transport system fused ATPase/permease subunit
MDELVVLNAGRIAERGTFSALIAQKGLFAGMAAQQGISSN